MNKKKKMEKGIEEKEEWIRLEIWIVVLKRIK